MTTESDHTHGHAWMRPDGGTITELPMWNNNPYEAARDAARNATGLRRIMWAAWGGRGKAQAERDAAAGRIVWDAVQLGGVEYGFVYPNGNHYTSLSDLIARAKSQPR